MIDSNTKQLIDTRHHCSNVIHTQTKYIKPTTNNTLQIHTYMAYNTHIYIFSKQGDILRQLFKCIKIKTIYIYRVIYL